MKDIQNELKQYEILLNSLPEGPWKMEEKCIGFGIDEEYCVTDSEGRIIARNWDIGDPDTMRFLAQIRNDLPKILNLLTSLSIENNMLKERIRHSWISSNIMSCPFSEGM